MVDGDDRHPMVTFTDLDLDGRFGERGVYGRVDGDRVVRVGGATKTVSHLQPSILGNTSAGAWRRRYGDSLARNIDDHSQSTFRTLFLDKLVGQEFGNRSGQVNTVDKDVDCNDRIEWFDQSSKESGLGFGCEGTHRRASRGRDLL